MKSARIDWNDPEAIRRVLIELRVALDDIDGAVRDRFAKKRRRVMGHVEQKAHYRDGRKTALQIVEYLMPPEPAAPPH